MTPEHADTTAAQTSAQNAQDTNEPSPVEITFTRRENPSFVGKRRIMEAGKQKLVTEAGGFRWIDKIMRHTDLESLAKDLKARAASGNWAITLGTPNRLGGNTPHEHSACFYEDTGSLVFWLDLDDLHVPDEMGSAENFPQGVRYAISLLPEPFQDAGWITIRTASTGSNPDYFSGRMGFYLSEPLKLHEMQALAAAIAALDRFNVSDEEREARKAKGLRTDIIDLTIYVWDDFYSSPRRIATLEMARRPASA